MIENSAHNYIRNLVAFQGGLNARLWWSVEFRTMSTCFAVLVSLLLKQNGLKN